MKSLFSPSIAALLVVASSVLSLAYAQTYYHPIEGLQGTYVGACEVNTCSGTYVDDGDTSGNYSNNSGSFYRTFCPGSAGNCIQLTFSSFDLEPVDQFGNCFDYLAILNGPTQPSPQIWSGCGSTLPPVITSTDPSGCLSVRFTSDGVDNAAGWVANITCVPCAGSGPSATLNTDCANAQFICDNMPVITANNEGPGLISDACLAGCAITENYSNWYKLNVTQAGSFAMTIDPTFSSVDFDFALYGPVSGGCAGLGTPVRCSYAANTGNTGMRSNSFDQSENVNGDGWVDPINNMAVGVYYLLVNQWEYYPNAQFQLDFSGTAVITGCDVTISGAVLSEDSVPVAGVTVDLSGTDTQSVVTDTAGIYSFNVPQGGNYIITPSKNNDLVPTNGVSTLDIIKIRNQILNQAPMGSVYKGLAAVEINAESDTSISTIDILHTRSLILGNTTMFPGNRLWQFVASDYVFPNPAQPFHFPKTRTYTNITTNQTNQNFIGIKLGDVNNSWDSTIP